jgi:hypothetical protein
VLLRQIGHELPAAEDVGLDDWESVYLNLLVGQFGKVDT